MERYRLIKSLDELNELPSSKGWRYSYPLHIRMYWRKDNTFFCEQTTLAVPRKAKNQDIEKHKAIATEPEKHYGLTRAELFKILLDKFGGEQGFYIVDLKNKHYWHFKNYEDIKDKLLELGAKEIQPAQKCGRRV